mmetsp:Transcript_35332/g.55178  ORF Transcript_35332/g.55178 Transcript_35332/m.55178 type:complete len:220 (-) Transcript_35332:274-933(-)
MECSVLNDPFASKGVEFLYLALLLRLAIQLQRRLKVRALQVQRKALALRNQVVIQVADTNTGVLGAIDGDLLWAISRIRVDRMILAVLVLLCFVQRNVPIESSTVRHHGPSMPFLYQVLRVVHLIPQASNLSVPHGVVPHRTHFFPVDIVRSQNGCCWSMVKLHMLSKVPELFPRGDNEVVVGVHRSAFVAKIRNFVLLGKRRNGPVVAVQIASSANIY